MRGLAATGVSSMCRASACSLGGDHLPRLKRTGLFYLIVLMAALGCGAPPTPAASQGATADGQRAAQRTRITAAILGDPVTLSATMNSTTTGGQPGVGEIERLIHAGLAIRDDRGTLRPQLAEAVPSLENGRWLVHPDGRMDITWTIRPNARWQDDTPVTASDLVFTVQVGQDRELPLFRHQAYNSIESVEAVDARTVTARWKEPYIWADTLFPSLPLAMPLPRHLL